MPCLHCNLQCNDHWVHLPYFWEHWVHLPYIWEHLGSIGQYLENADNTPFKIRPLVRGSVLHLCSNFAGLHFRVTVGRLH
jgi:hypothetical protein